MLGAEEHTLVEGGVAEAIAGAHDVLEGATHVLIGAGAGLSTAAGLAYFGQRFDDHFKNFIDYYGLTDMYSAADYPFPDEESKWAYWSEHIWVNRFEPPALDLYNDLYDYFKNRDCFVLTTNADGQFVKAGFPKNRVFAMHGDYGMMQCSKGCHEKVYADKDAVAAMRLDTEGGRRVRITDGALVPKCPVCGAAMEPWLRLHSSFVEGEEWQGARRGYASWLEEALDSGGLVLLEMGVGFSAPDDIRFPFERMSAQYGCPLIRMNYDAPLPGSGEAGRTVVIQGDIAQTWPRVANGA